MLGDEVVVDPAGLDEQVEQAVEEREVGAGAHLQVQVGLLGRRRAARVDDDQLGARPDPVEQPQEQDRVAVGHVRADDEEHVGVVEVVVGAGRAVGAERQLVAGAGAGHAQPRVGLDLVGPDEALGQLVGEVLGLDRHLARHVEGDGVRPVLVEHVPQAPGGAGDRLVGGARRVLGVAVGPHEPGRDASLGAQHVGARDALRAEPTGVRRVVPVARRPHRDASAVVVGGDVEHDTAADAAVRADRLDGRGDGRAGIPFDGGGGGAIGSAARRCAASVDDGVGDDVVDDGRYEIGDGGHVRPRPAGAATAAGRRPT